MHYGWREARGGEFLLKDGERPDNALAGGGIDESAHDPQAESSILVDAYRSDDLKDAGESHHRTHNPYRCQGGYHQIPEGNDAKEAAPRPARRTAPCRPQLLGLGRKTRIF